MPVCLTDFKIVVTKVLQTPDEMDPMGVGNKTQNYKGVHKNHAHIVFH